MLTQDDVIYFLITDRFCNGEPGNDQGTDAANPRAFHGGDFAGLKQKIPYLKKLGVTAVWLTPVYLNVPDFFDSAGYHGYWAIDFERVDPHLAGANPESARQSRARFKALVDSFHKARLKIILDMVVNHTGYHTPAYHAHPHTRFEDRHFNVHEPGDPIEQWLYGLPDLDHDQVEVADYFVQNILDWIEETGIDGIRMDTVRHVEDAFWYLLKSQVKTSHPEITLIGEVLDPNPGTIGRYQQEHDFDTLFDFPLCHALKRTLIYGASMTELARPRLHRSEPKGALDVTKPYTNANRLVTLLDNHDLDRRIMTEILDHVGHWDRQLACKVLKLCLAFLFTTRGIPQVYYGTEIGAEGGRDPDNRKDMKWTVFGANHRPKAVHQFEREIYDHTVKMIGLRARNPAVRHGYLLTLYSDRFFYAFMREFRGNVVVVAINNGRDPMPGPASIDLAGNANIPPRIRKLLPDTTTLASQFDGLPDIAVAAGKLHVQLPGKTGGVYVL
jgi:alpha-amylase